MADLWLDNPMVLSSVFYPRRATPGGSQVADARDGTIPVAEDIALGYRLFPHTPDAPVVLYFHGNGETAADYDLFAAQYRAVGVSLLVVDYRGYGWSTGRPLLSALFPDAVAVVEAVPGVLAEAGLSPAAPLFVMGRSLGSIAAIHAAYTLPACLKGLIVESGIGHALAALVRWGFAASLLENLPDPIGNVRKISEITLPLLLIHGAWDALLPIENAEALYAASPATAKRFLRIPQAGHNDLMFAGQDVYYTALAAFVRDVKANAGMDSD